MTAPPDGSADPSAQDRRDELIVAAHRWIAQDPDPVTREALLEVIARGDLAELTELVSGRLSFGTAGLRAPLGPGPNRMNRLVVRQSAAGIARVLRSSGTDPRRGVVVAHDARHGSAAFCADLVEVLTAHGLDVHVLDGPTPTPLGAFAVRHLNAAAGLVVTASHNPAADNGVKVYWGDGAQIVPPVDARIAAAIDEVADRGAAVPPGTTPGRTVHLGGPADDTELVRAYLREALATRGGSAVPPAPAVPISIVVTSLHGVGATLLERVLDAGGHRDVHPVERQRHPDPDFPTVAFPNPEEPGALDELLALAEERHAHVALANDPDADRLAVAVPGREGGWTALSGDELGALLTHHLLARAGRSHERLVATTVVSSRLAGRIAEQAGAHFVETLTGFKWLCRPGIEHPEWQQVLLYEEALGYAIGPAARDKDGIVAALVVADLIAELHQERRSVWEVLDELARAHGAHVQRNGSVRFEGADWRARVDRATSTLASDPPEQLGGLEVVAHDRPAPDALRFRLSDDTRIVVRPSGTEPKWKYYCEAVEPVTASESADAARARATSRLDRVVTDVRSLATG
jgi:phosphomannomutase